ncbi:MAG: hypothetical protein ABF700_11320, partial [Liquorilactobacillus ghanensis]
LILRDFSNKSVNAIDDYLNIFLKTIRRIFIENEKFIVETADLVLAGEAPLSTKIEKIIATIKSL